MMDYSANNRIVQSCERARIRTFNQWFKGSAVRICFSHPKAYFFRPIHWTVLKTVSWMHVEVCQQLHIQWAS